MQLWCCVFLLLKSWCWRLLAEVGESWREVVIFIKRPVLNFSVVPWCSGWLQRVGVVWDHIRCWISQELTRVGVLSRWIGRPTDFGFDRAAKFLLQDSQSRFCECPSTSALFEGVLCNAVEFGQLYLLVFFWRRSLTSGSLSFLRDVGDSQQFFKVFGFSKDVREHHLWTVKLTNGHTRCTLCTSTRPLEPETLCC